MAFCGCKWIFRFPLNVLRYNMRTYSVKRRAPKVKKEYPYELDKLIHWIKETDKAFGPKRKFTKTGKVRKSKKLNHLDEHLSVMSACSSVSNYDESDMFSKNNTSETKCNDNDIPTQVMAPHAPLPEAIYNMECMQQPSKIDLQSKESHVNFTLKKYVSKLQSDKLDVFNSQGQKDNYSRDTYMTSHLSWSESKTNTMKNEQNVLDEKAMSERLKSVQHYGESTSDWPMKDNVLLKVNSWKHNLQASRTFTDEVKTESAEENTSEIYIPKLAPIPQPRSTTPNLSILSNITSTVSKFKPSSSLPIEPPSSYDIISKVPLFPKENESWPPVAESNQLKAFHNDIQLLDFRRPPSVKNILSKTMSDTNRFFLVRWRDKMIKTLGEEGFQQLQETTLKKGYNLHANIHDYLSGKPVSSIQIMPDNEGHWASLQSTFKVLSDISAIEVAVFNPFLLYKGVFDCIAKYKDLLCVIDWKVSKKPKAFIKDTYDDPLQIVAYMGAVNASEEFLQKFGQVNNGLLVVAYPDGEPAHVHMMDKKMCLEYWRTWTERLYDFYQLTYTEKFEPKTVKEENEELSAKTVP